jgi:mono/diheme cytochrome c family protein
MSIRFCWLASVVLLLVVFAMAYKFLWQGQVAPASDGRNAILMPEGERDLVLTEMRSFLQAVQAILTAANADDAAAIAEAARSVGMATSEGMPGTLVARLPGSFKKLGFDTHGRFDQLALDAEQLGDVQHSLQQLAELMSNCVACHAAYRIDLLGE